MNFHINKTKIFLRLDEYGITIQMLSKLTNLSYHYLNRMFEGKTKKILPFLTLSKILHLPLEEIISY